MGARRLAAPALDPRPGARRHGPPNPGLGPRHRPLEDGRQPAPHPVGPAHAGHARRRLDAAVGLGPDMDRVRPGVRAHPGGAPRRRGPAAATEGHLQAEPRAGGRRRSQPRRGARRAGPHVPDAPGLAHARRHRADPRPPVRDAAKPPGMDDRRPGQGERRPRRRRVLPADGRRRGDRGGGRGPRPRAEARGGPDRGAVRGPLAGRPAGRAAGQHATRRVGSGAARARRRGVAAPDRPPDLAVLRDVRRSRGPRASARQLPGRPAPRRGAPDVADEHRDVPPGNRHRPRLRVDRDAGDGRPARGDARVDREPRALPGAPLQLVRHARPPPARARVRLVGRQRQPRRPPHHAVERVPAHDR